MNTKTSWALLGMVLLGVLFVPLIPNDVSLDCETSADSSQDCDETAGYVSAYTKYFSH